MSNAKGSHNYTAGQLAEIVARREKGQEFQAIADAINNQYGIDVSDSSVRHAYIRHSNIAEVKNSVGAIKVLKEIARIKRNNSLTAKENKTILQSLNDREDLLEQLTSMVDKLPKSLAQVTMTEIDPSKRSMTVEALLSDVHVGKVTKTFDLKECRKRLRTYTTVLLHEIERKEAHYNVEHVIIAMLGDMIENAMMHGKESAVNCEFGNAEQVRQAIELLFLEVLVPVANTGRKITVVGIAGNHDRDEEKPTFNDPGKASLTWVIYQMLKLLCDRQGYTNMTWNIPEGVYTTLDIYGDTILYEHGDRVKGTNDKKSFLANMVKRSGQVGKVIKGMRIGHWHEFNCLDNGAVIVNGSVPGQDSYADVNGYNSLPGQAITYYVKTKNRDNAYYYSFLVQLGTNN
jgi:hypothetical protein